MLKMGLTPSVTTTMTITLVTAAMHLVQHPTLISRATTVVAAMGQEQRRLRKKLRSASVACASVNA
jgi:hypothetical protein